MPVQPIRRPGPLLRTLALAGALAATTGALPVVGQPLERRDQPATAAAAADKPAVPLPEKPGGDAPALLPEVKLNDVNFPDLIQFLRDVDPTFQAVVSYTPGAAEGGPRIQELRLKNVTSEGIMQLLAETYPQITMNQVPAPDGKHRIWAIRIDRDPRADRVVAAAGEPTTTVWRLHEAVDELAAK